MSVQLLGAALLYGLIVFDLVVLGFLGVRALVEDLVDRAGRFTLPED